MSAIYDIAGTSSDTFMLNGKLTFMQGDTEPTEYQGRDGDVYYQTNGNIWVKIRGAWNNTTSLSLPQPSNILSKMIYSDGNNFIATDYTHDDVALKSKQNTFSETNTFNAPTIFTSGIEIKHATPYVDFHFNNSTLDFTSRIIESTSGQLSVINQSGNDAQNVATNSTTVKAIATQGWVNDPAKSTNVVHRTGDESIAGTKTFTGTAKFNNVIQGTALRAQWGDIAEYNSADADYPYGTLVQFGGEKEFTIASDEVNAVVANLETVALIINAKNDFEHPLPLVLAGRVKVRVNGEVKKFDKLYLSMDEKGVASNVVNGKHFGRALEDSVDGYVLANVQMIV